MTPFDCTLRINTAERPDEWEDGRYIFPRGMPNPGEIMTLPDGREIKIIGSGMIDLVSLAWATGLAPAAV